MAYSSMHSTTGELFGHETKGMSVFQRAVHWFKERAELRRAEDELHNMSNAELSDLGLTRGDIHHAVRRSGI